MLERGVVDEGRDVEIDGEERSAIARIDELHAQEESPSAHLSHDLGALERGLELVPQAGSPLCHPLHQSSFDEHVEDGVADGHGEGGAIPRVTEVELARALIDGVVHVLAADDRAYGRVPRAEPLPDRDDVRLDRQLMGREPAPDPAHAG